MTDKSLPDIPPENLDWIDQTRVPAIISTDPLENDKMPNGRRLIRRDMKLAARMIIKKEKASEALADGLPNAGESHHVISNALYDFWNVIAEAVKKLGGVDLFYGSTWTMNRQNVLDLMSLIDTGKITTCRILTGTYFKRRESAVYAQLITGLAQRGQKYVAFNNHTKIAMMHAVTNKHEWIVFEGSANWTANPRLENYTITNDLGLFQFHQTWMDEMLRLSKDGESVNPDYNYKVGE
jgi:hypothetical protein